MVFEIIISQHSLSACYVYTRENSLIIRVLIYPGNFIRKMINYFGAINFTDNHSSLFKPQKKEKEMKERKEQAYA